MAIPYGERIRRIRSVRGWTQDYLSALVGVSRFPISEAENAQSPDDISPRLRYAIEAAFGLDLMSPDIDAAFAVLDGQDADPDQVSNALAWLE